MKKEYSKPDVTICKFPDNQDITTSNFTIGMGDDGAFYDDIW